MAQTQQPVVIAGAGPVGLALAMRLGHCGIPCVVLEADADINRDLRASTFHPPTLEMLDEHGITAALIEAGLVAPTWQVRMHNTGEFAQFDLSALKDDTRHPYRLQCEQWILADLLVKHIRQHLPHVRLLFGHGLTSFAQTADGVRVLHGVPDGSSAELQASFLVGADGGKSQVRKQLDLSFEGHTFPETTILATTLFPFHKHVSDLAFINYCWSEAGTFSLLRLKNLWRVSLYPDAEESMDHALTTPAVLEKLNRIAPEFGDTDVMEVRPYRIHQRVVNNYVVGRVILAGDAAHLNSPSGGMGMNGGIHDAFNLADKLQGIWHGGPLSLLNLYERQRRPIAMAHVLEQSGRNRARMQERDVDKRRAALLELQRKANDPALHRAHLLNTSMISGLRESEAVV